MVIVMIKSGDLVIWLLDQPGCRTAVGIFIKIANRRHEFGNKYSAYYEIYWTDTSNIGYHNKCEFGKWIKKL